MTLGSTGAVRWFTAVRDSSLAAGAHDCFAMTYWRCIGRRPHDVFLCSYPKSGRTWLRFLLTYYQLRLADVDFDLTLRNLATLSPNVTLFSEFRLRAPDLDRPIHRILATHSTLPWLFHGLPIILIRRDLRDVLVSFYHHRKARGELKGDLESFLWSRWGLRHAVDYSNRWHRALQHFPAGTVLETSYELLHAEPVQEVSDCLRFMGLEVREQLVTEAVTYAAAESMRKLEARWGTPDFSVGDLKHDENAFQVRKARVGGYREELSAAAIARIEAILSAELLDNQATAATRSDDRR